MKKTTKTESITLEWALTIYSASLSKESEPNIKIQLSTFNSYLKDIRDIEFIKSVSEKDIEAYLIYFLETGKQPKKDSYIWAKKDLIKRYFNWLVQEGHIDYSPANNIKLGKKPKSRGVYLNNTDYFKFVNKIVEEIEIREEKKDKRVMLSYRNYICVLLMTHLGPRSIEALKRIVFDKIDFQDKSILLRRAKRGKRVYLYGSEKFFEILKKYVELAKINPGDTLFKSQKGGDLTYDALNEQIHKYLVNAGVYKQGLNSHLCRRKFGTNAKDSGLTPFEIIKIMDHSDTSNLKSYIDVTDQDCKAAVNLNPILQVIDFDLIKNLKKVS